MTREELLKVMDRTWDEGEECVDALLEFLGGDCELVADVITYDRSFNRYYCSHSWSDLAYEIIQDECLDEDDIYDFLCKHADNEEVVRAYLIDMNWAIDKTTGIAIGFDDDVNVVNHEIE